MATDLLSQWNAATGGSIQILDPGSTASQFRQKVCMSAIAAAIAIANEAPVTINHSNRAALAKAVAGDPLHWMVPFAIALASQGLDDASIDTAINTGIATVWNTLAGVV